MFKKLDKKRETKLHKTPCVTKQWIRKICRVPGGKLRKKSIKTKFKRELFGR